MERGQPMNFRVGTGGIRAGRRRLLACAQSPVVRFRSTVGFSESMTGFNHQIHEAHEIFHAVFDAEGRARRLRLE